MDPPLGIKGLSDQGKGELVCADEIKKIFCKTLRLTETFIVQSAIKK